MSYLGRSYSLAAGVVIFWALAPLLYPAPTVRADGRRDHSCTVDVAGSFASPQGLDGKNFEDGWGLRTGIGAALWQRKEPRGWSAFLTSHYNYDKFRATAAALKTVQAGDSQLNTATSAHSG